MKNTLNVETVGDLKIVVTREFDAPRTLVWDAMCKPELLRRWLVGPPGWEMTVCEDEHRVGGVFHWEWRGPDGAVLKVSGVNREIVPPERGVRTEVFEGTGFPPMGEQLATLVLTEKGDQTSLTLTVEYPSKEARDGAIAGGMDKGLAASYDRFDELLREISG